MFKPIDPTPFKAQFQYLPVGELLRRDPYNPSEFRRTQPTEYFHISGRNYSVKQIIYIMHHSCLPRYILTKDGTQYIGIENLVGTNDSPRWAGRKAIKYKRAKDGSFIPVESSLSDRD